MRLALVDLSAVWWTNWHATADSDLSAAYDSTLRMISAVSANHDQTVICLDSPKSRRREMEPTYKAQREPKPQAALEQARRLLAELKKRWPCYQVDGLEGDDIVATFVGRMDEIKGLYNPRRHFGEYELCDGLELVIVGCDKDFWQLLGPNVSMWNFSTGHPFTAADLMAKHGIKPCQAVDWQALVGDAADNLPGIKGCGPKEPRRGCCNSLALLKWSWHCQAQANRVRWQKAVAFQPAESSDLIYRNLELMRLVVIKKECRLKLFGKNRNGSPRNAGLSNGSQNKRKRRPKWRHQAHYHHSQSQSQRLASRRHHRPASLTGPWLWASQPTSPGHWSPWTCANLRLLLPSFTNRGFISASFEARMR